MDLSFTIYDVSAHVRHGRGTKKRGVVGEEEDWEGSSELLTCNEKVA